MSRMLVSTGNFQRIIRDVKNMRDVFKCEYLDCDLNYERLVVSAEAKEENVSIKNTYTGGGMGWQASEICDGKGGNDREAGCSTASLDCQPNSGGTWRRVTPEDFNFSLQCMKDIVGL